MSACATGSAASLTVSEGEAYRARIQTRNGVLPVIENAASVDGPFFDWVIQDGPATAVPALAPTNVFLLALALAVSAFLAPRSALRDAVRGRSVSSRPTRSS